MLGRVVGCVILPRLERVELVEDEEQFAATTSNITNRRVSDDGRVVVHVCQRVIGNLSLPVVRVQPDRDMLAYEIQLAHQRVGIVWVVHRRLGPAHQPDLAPFFETPEPVSQVKAHPRRTRGTALVDAHVTHAHGVLHTQDGVVLVGVGQEGNHLRGVPGSPRLKQPPERIDVKQYVAAAHHPQFMTLLSRLGAEVQRPLAELQVRPAILRDHGVKFTQRTNTP